MGLFQRKAPPPCAPFLPYVIHNDLFYQATVSPCAPDTKFPGLGLIWVFDIVCEKLLKAQAFKVGLDAGNQIEIISGFDLSEHGRFLIKIHRAE